MYSFREIKNKIKKTPIIDSGGRLFLANLDFLRNTFSEIKGLIKFRRLMKKSHIKLELGSGSKRGSNGWITVDKGSGADIFFDLRNRMPLNDNSVDKIYSSHLLEHIPFNELISFLQECKRVLKPNGEFSVCVPNAKLYINSYLNDKMFIDSSKGEDFVCFENFPETLSKLDQVNYMAYMGDQHKYMFDEENLINTLFKAGFKTARLRKYDEDLDLKMRDFESIYAVAYKT